MSRPKRCFVAAIAAFGVAVSLTLHCLSSDGSSADEHRSKPKPLVAAVWVKPGASGAKEVVIEPDLQKIKARGLTPEQIRRATEGIRFVSGEWDITVDKKEYDLAAVAKLTVRKSKRRRSRSSCGAAGRRSLDRTPRG